MLRRLSVIASLLVLAGCGSPNPAKPDAGLVQVVRVIDGDTVVLTGGERVRIIGIDTPETVSPKVKDECGGPEATAFARRYLLNRMVRVVIDDTQGDHDAYDRLLAYLEVDGRDDYGKAILSQGLAQEYTYDVPYARQLEYQRLARLARRDGAGTWGRCGGFDKPLG